MLIIASDIHLGDGTCGKTISASAFRLFVERLKELAFNASWRTDGNYRPIEHIDILLLGDILDPLHSTTWLAKVPDESGAVRPWTDNQAPDYASLVKAITTNILAKNSPSIDFIKSLTSPDGLCLPAATHSGQPDMSPGALVPVSVRVHYMVGNHDWYYHLPGPAFEVTRKEIIRSFGLSNPPGPFPHQLHEATDLQNLLESYQVFAQHGDLYDPLNYPKEKGRDASSLGDAFVVDIINRFPLEVERRLKGDLPPGTLEALHELANVRPVLATPLWIGSQLRQNNISPAVQRQLKEVWDEVCSDFLALPFIQGLDQPHKLDLVDVLELAVRVTDRFSFKTIDDIASWARKKFNTNERTFARHALKEQAFLNRSAMFVVYGHTHHHEIVPLDSFPGMQQATNQIYINSGTWHTYFDLAIYKPRQQKFIPYQVLTYIAFYKGDESGGRKFETWSGTFSD
jgi:UDP-2,3-diacylglucosamine pyrophosphatase LpxH